MSTIATSSAGVPLELFLNDVNVSNTQKAECLKIVSTVLKNLNDPARASDPKYRQLRLENTKIKQNLAQHAPIMSYLQMIGFAIVTEGGGRFFRIEQPEEANMRAALTQITAASERIHKLLLHRQSSSSVSGHSSSSTPSEKQKARLLLEDKKRKEKEEDRLARKRTRALIKADKHVRENDPNWKPSVSAAAAKTGDAMETFRDKFGE